MDGGGGYFLVGGRKWSCPGPRVWRASQQSHSRDLGVARYPQEVRCESLLESTKEGLCLMDQVKIGLGHPFFNSGFDRVLVINKDADVFDKGGEILLEQMVQCMHQGVKFCSIV